MPILISSNGLETKEIRTKFIELSEGMDRAVTIITTASEVYKEKNRNTVKLSEQLHLLDYHVTFLDIEHQSAEALQFADNIIIAGGNPYYLLHHLKRSGADEILMERARSGKFIYGISAGAFMLMENMDIVDVITPQMNQIELTDKSCLGLIPDIVLPHYDRFVQEGIINQKIIDAYEVANKKSIVRLHEHEFKVYQ